MLPETLGESSRSPNKPWILGLRLLQRRETGRQGCHGGSWGLGLPCQEMGSCVCICVPPPTLSDRTSCVLAVSIFSQNWKEGKFGGQATSPSSCWQHPQHVVRGRLGAPSPSSSGRQDSAPSHLWHRLEN